MSSKSVQLWRNNTKKKIVQSMGGKCCRCGYCKSISALHMHHIEPKNKIDEIANMLKNPRKIELILEECKKCVLLCSNCHFEYHDSLWNIEEINIPKIDKSFFKLPNEDSEPCICCGKLTSNLKFCSTECIGKHSGIGYGIPWPNNEILLEMNRKMKKSKICSLLNCSFSALAKRLRKLQSL